MAGSAAKLLVIMTGLAWAAALSLAGLWLYFALAAVSDPSLAPVLRSTGLVALVAGQLVFLVCVNDRVFPNVHRLVQGGVEMVACAALLIGLLVVAAQLVARLPA